jgi:uncharacterized membrane protein YfcA
MALGVTATTGLLLFAYSPAAASSVVHLVEIGTSLLNGTFHARAKNVDWRVVLLVGIPGAVGAFVGAVLLASVNLGLSKPWTAAILLALGIIIIVRFLRASTPPPSGKSHAAWILPLGGVAGFIDATAGGGWGIITTSSLMASNAMTPNRVVGTTSTARFLVAVAGSVGFILGLGVSGIEWASVAAMFLGGLIAAPIAARLVRIAPQRTLGLITGVAVVVLNVRQFTVSLDANLPTVVCAMGLALVVTTATILGIVLRPRLTRTQ